LRGGLIFVVVVMEESGVRENCFFRISAYV